MGLRGIERVTDIHHTTIMGWVREAGLKLPDTPETDEEPEITDLDELQTFVGNKRHKVWLWTAVNHWRPGIICYSKSVEMIKCSIRLLLHYLRFKTVPLSG